MHKILYYMTSLIIFLFSLLYFTLSIKCLASNSFFLLETPLTNNMYIIDLNLYFLIDWMSSFFMSFISLISSMVILYAKDYMKSDKKKIKFLILMLLFILSMNLLVICPNLMMILLGWDGLGFISFFLVMYYQNETSNFASQITILTNRIGDIGLIMGIIFMMNFYSWDMADSMNSKNMLYFTIMLTFLGGITKSAQIPFSAWLPAAMAAPTPVSALVHSSTLVTAGVYLFIRFYKFFSNQQMSELLLLSATITMFISSFNAIFEMDLKKIIALSTLSQLSVMMFTLSMSNANLAFFHMVTHAIFKANLFLCAGLIIHNTSNWQDTRQLNNLTFLSPSAAMSLSTSNMALMGFPFLSGFYSKDLILENLYMLNNSFIIMFLICISTLFTSIYSLRLTFMSFKLANNTPLNNFYTSYTSIYPILLLTNMAMITGCLLSWLLFPSPSFIFLPFFLKPFNSIIIMMSLIFFFSFYKSFINCIQTPFINSFLSKLWYMDNISFTLTWTPSYINFLNKNMETWMELSKNQTVFKEFSYLNFISWTFTNSNINYFLKIILFVFLMSFFL